MFFAPAKLNLFLAVTGKREDGFHELVSLVAPLEFGDDLAIEAAAGGVYSLSCDTPGVPLDGSNLVLRAARLFAERTGWRGGAHFRLVKRIPMGAGLGGGSSDGAAALQALNDMAQTNLSRADLAELAAQLGSDCPLFLHHRACLIRGRGERIEPLSVHSAQRLVGRRVLVFKPSFSIDTAWAYRTLAADPGRNYVSVTEAERRLTAWLADVTAPAEKVLFNNFERVAFDKFLALPALLERLRQKYGVAVGMSGSGSACFALLDGQTDPDLIRHDIREAWGDAAFAIETRMG